MKTNWISSMFIGLLPLGLFVSVFVVGCWVGQYTSPEVRLAIIIGLYCTFGAFTIWLVDIDDKLNPRPPSMYDDYTMLG
jgi:hypothetical protein